MVRGSSERNEIDFIEKGGQSRWELVANDNNSILGRLFRMIHEFGGLRER